MPIRKIEQLTGTDEKAVSSVMYYWVDKAVNLQDLSMIYSLAIDETSFKKGHSYVSPIIDAIGRRVIDVEEGRGSDVVDKFAEKLVKQGGNPDNIKSVTSDMSPAFISGVKRNFPKATLVADKFHVKQLLIKAMDDVRKAEQRKSTDKKELFQGRKLLMIPNARQNEEQQAKIKAISKKYPESGRAFRIVNTLDDFYKSNDIFEAEIALTGLISWMRRSRLQPMKDAAVTLKNKAEMILNYFLNRITNAICEGINSMIQAAKRRARGYGTLKGYIAMIYLAVGKLKLECPDLWSIN